MSSHEFVHEVGVWREQQGRIRTKTNAVDQVVEHQRAAARRHAFAARFDNSNAEILAFDLAGLGKTLPPESRAKHQDRQRRGGSAVSRVLAPGGPFELLENGVAQHHGIAQRLQVEALGMNRIAGLAAADQ